MDVACFVARMVFISMDWQVAQLTYWKDSIIFRGYVSIPILGTISSVTVKEGATIGSNWWLPEKPAYPDIGIVPLCQKKWGSLFTKTFRGGIFRWRFSSYTWYFPSLPCQADGSFVVPVDEIHPLSSVCHPRKKHICPFIVRRCYTDIIQIIQLHPSDICR